MVKGQPGYLGPALAYNGDVYSLWGQLSDVIRNGKAESQPEEYLGSDQNRTRNFVYGMHHRALAVGRAVAHHIELGGRKQLADIGGGPGTYSALITAATPGLKATVFDLPGVVEVAQEIITQMGADAQVTTHGFDYYSDDLPGRYDAALISGVLHREQPEGVRAISGEDLEGFGNRWCALHLRRDAERRPHTRSSNDVCLKYASSLT